MITIKAPAWEKYGDDALAARIADIVVGREAALPRQHDKPHENGKHQLDTANNWFLRRTDRHTLVLTCRHGTHWQSDRWEALQTAIELLLQ